MAIDVKDLPPAYQVQVLGKLMKQVRGKQRVPVPPPDDSAPVGGRKYHNKPTERVTPSGAVIRFDSQKEARRYDYLIALEQAGQIRDLRLQVDFTLQEAYTDSGGRRVRAIRYKADFTYLRKYFVDEDGFMEEKIHWKLVVEDVKSRATRTKEYIMKRKMMKERFNIDIQEV